MGKINVLLISDIGEKLVRQIAGVDPRINVMDASRIVAPPSVSVLHGPNLVGKEFDEMLAKAEIIYGYRAPENAAARAPGLKWIQCMVAGVDRLLTPDLIESKVILTSARGIHGTPVGEVALEMMLLLAKKAPFCFENKRNKRWESFIPDLLRSQVAGIVGLGSIGKEIARMCKAFGMTVIATKRSARQDTRAKNVDKFVPRDRLLELMAESDFVVMVLPATPETNKIVGEKELRAMKETAYLVNVGRGQTLDEEALVRALAERWIAGAGLDAYSVEPLPQTSKLWELPNVYISPHVSGRMTNYESLATQLFCENLKRYIEGNKLRNIVNKKRGY